MVQPDLDELDDSSSVASIYDIIDNVTADFISVPAATHVTHTQQFPVSQYKAPILDIPGVFAGSASNNKFSWNSPFSMDILSLLSPQSAADHASSSQAPRPQKR